MSSLYGANPGASTRRCRGQLQLFGCVSNSQPWKSRYAHRPKKWLFLPFKAHFDEKRDLRAGYRDRLRIDNFDFELGSEC